MSAFEFEAAAVSEFPFDGRLWREEQGVLRQIPGTQEDGAGGVNEDGYRTPTSSEYRIPEVLECPPAPRKPKREFRLKRKRARALQVQEVDPNEIELFLRQILVHLTPESGQKVRKVRGD
ncbi:cyclin-dependent protein kinase inhibitor SMR2-like [Nymphaea colorata]|uniref:cyclin-dependent protein kinase inhibitor SMR2-like n=1 Tax=Nymphaea colorata TaxID=210225 RepID=UPI00129E5A0B|nr:cyclin-dependent protein kinase inhibitor SMR2-like [Nymphaea colorata]